VKQQPSRVTRLRGHSDEGRWVAWGGLPDPRLRPHVLRYVGYAANSAQPLARREAPGTVIPLEIAFDAPYGIRALDTLDAHERPVAHDAFLGGLSDRATVVTAGVRERCIQVDFTPLGARRFLGAPMDTVAHRTVDLSDLLGPSLELLRERLLETDSWSARFALLDAILLARMGSMAVTDEVAWAWEQLRRSHGTVRVGALTSQLGWTRRRLGAAFREEVGLTPKPFARLLRFEEARRRLGLGEPAIAVAASTGYSDQAHMVREFSALAGVTPARESTELPLEE